MQLVACLALLVIGTNAATEQRQCLCSEFHPCLGNALNVLDECADKCKSHVTKLGVSFPKFSECVVGFRPKLQKAIDCAFAAFGGDKVCAKEKGPMIPRRFPETIILAAFREITSMLKNSDLLTETTALLGHGQKHGSCLSKCAQESKCYKLDCTLDLPSDNEIVATAKKCAIDAGFTTPVAKEICNCIAEAGLKELKPMCPKIDIK